jgi:thiol-disulfide isomerase/thioredoxin
MMELRKRYRRGASATAYVVLLNLAMLWLGGCLAPLVAPDAEAQPLAPDFQLATLHGDEVSLEDFRDQWVLLNFWATWCEPCLEEMPYLAALDDRPDLPLKVIGVNMREDPDLVRAYLAELDLSMTIALQPDDATLLAYDVRGLPISILIAPDGSLIHRFTGPLLPEAFEPLLQDAIAIFVDGTLR